MKSRSPLLLLVGLLPLLSMGQEANEETIDWTAGKKLIWADYLSSPDLNSDAAASTTTYLGIEYHIVDGRLTYKITCRFSKTRSWGRHKTPYILAHEQAHFDIAEIFARRLNRDVQQYRFNKDNFEKELKRIYQDISNDKEAWQNRYDDETNHSIKKDKQAEWLQKIADELNGLKDFAGYPSLGSD